VLVPAGAMFAVLLATSTRYGYHRDELYFIQAGAHPAFGYPDQPPLVPLLCQAMQRLAPGSLTVLRLPSAVSAAATVLVAALVAREAGGGSWSPPHAPRCRRSRWSPATSSRPPRSTCCSPRCCAG
jgi:4-amino-4-deoxy-L-arabinose transferase-like glycosyltransferase